jgi:hypothetical protein
MFMLPQSAAEPDRCLRRRRPGRKNLPFECERRGGYMVRSVSNHSIES